MSKKTILTLLKTVLPLMLGVYLVWVFFSDMAKEPKKLEAFYKAFYEADYFWIVLSLIVGVISNFSRGYRWKYALEPLGYQTGFWNRYHAVMIGYLVNFTIPRAGEASRSGMLYRSDGVPFSSSFGTIIAERAIDLVILGGITLVTLLIGFDDFLLIKAKIMAQNATQQTAQTTMSWEKIVYILILLVGLVFAYFVVFRQAFREKFLRFVKEVIQGVFSIFKLKQPFAYLFHTIVIWGCYLIMFVLPFYALEPTKDVPVECILLGFVAGSIGITFTNGGIGTYPLLVGYVVAYFIEKDHPQDALAIGNAMGMLVWVTQTVLLIALGLISLFLLPTNYSKENEPARVPEA